MKCAYAAPGTYGHECGAPATNILVTVRPESTRQCLLGLGMVPSADGLSRSFRCERHRGVREMGDGKTIRTEEVAR